MCNGVLLFLCSFAPYACAPRLLVAESDVLSVLSWVPGVWECDVRQCAVAVVGCQLCFVAVPCIGLWLPVKIMDFRYMQYVATMQRMLVCRPACNNQLLVSFALSIGVQ